MASLGRLTNSVVSAINENNLALANLNFDFSLVTVQAPPEYNELGSALTMRRRENAECGTAHRTARKLGALFDSIIPRVPLLISSYGKRASEIMAMPGVNPTGSAQRHGPFANFVGADATSIWAAATSGSSSIAVHLLACMLARAFEDPAVASSVWAELVSGRQSEVEQATRAGFTTAQFAAVNAASQQFPREELRQWDASARAWLRGGDAAMVREHTQLQLIIKNIAIPVGGLGGTSLYADVTSAWINAMAGLERLLAGEPQCVTNGAILLAMSSWHLYPSMTVLGSPVKTIETKDPLLKGAGIVTIGITKNTNVEDDDSHGIHWSLALSHYRYYGHPVVATSSTGDRLTMDELHLIALGGVLAAWGMPRGDPTPAARWFVALYKCVNKVKPLLERPLWLSFLATAAKSLLSNTSVAYHRHLLALVDFGHRRSRTFLGLDSFKKNKNARRGAPMPWFGLRSSHVLRAMSEEKPSEAAIQYLREICIYGELEQDDALITLITPFGGRLKQGWKHVYATAVPKQGSTLHPSHSQALSTSSNPPELEKSSTASNMKMKATDNHDNDDDDDDDDDDNLESVSPHRRWIAEFGRTGIRIDDRTIISTVNSIDVHWYQNLSGSTREKGPQIDPVEVERRLVEQMVYKEEVTGDAFGADEPDTYLSYKIPDRYFNGTITRAKEYSGGDALGRLSTPLEHDDIPVRRNTSCIDGSRSSILQCAASIQGGLKKLWSGPVDFQGLLDTKQDLFRLWFRTISDSKRERFDDRLRGLRSGTPESLVSLETSTQALESSANPLLVWQYLEGPEPYEPDDFIKPLLDLLDSERQGCESVLQPLRNLAFATSIYETLEGATISSRIVDTGIADVSWAGSGTSSSSSSSSSSRLAPKRADVFSCIAMLETGTVHLRPEEMQNVLGLSVGNSLYVLLRFLTDPAVQVDRTAVTRLVGNVGRAGVSLLVAPAARPLVRELSSSYRAVSYEAFDGAWEDNFAGTSLHLTFTKHEFPVDYGVAGIMDHQVFLVESVISVYDSGNWVADLDVLAAFDDPDTVPIMSQPRRPSSASPGEALGGHNRALECSHPPSLNDEAARNLASIDTWEGGAGCTAGHRPCPRTQELGCKACDSDRPLAKAKCRTR